MEAGSDDFGIMTLIFFHFISESVIRDDWEQNLIKTRDTAIRRYGGDFIIGKLKTNNIDDTT